MSNKLLGYIKEKDLTHDDVIALIDKHLQRSVSEEGEPDGEEEVVEGEESENSTPNDEVEENDEIEQISESQKEKLVELDKIYKDASKKLEEINKIVSKIKRKEPPKGDISDEALTTNQKIKANWFEVDVWSYIKN